MPDDLIPIFLDYTGDINQTPEELENSHCFFKVEYDGHYFDGMLTIRDCTFGHYCAICKKLYLLRGPAGLKRHIKSANHQSMFKRRGYRWRPPAKNDIIHWFIKKNYRYRCLNDVDSKKTIESVKYFNIDLNNIQ